MYKVSTIVKKSVLTLSLCLAMVLWIGLTAPQTRSVNNYVDNVVFSQNTVCFHTKASFTTGNSNPYSASCAGASGFGFFKGHNYAYPVAVLFGSGPYAFTTPYPFTPVYLSRTTYDGGYYNWSFNLDAGINYCFTLYPIDGKSFLTTCNDPAHYSGLENWTRLSLIPDLDSSDYIEIVDGAYGLFPSGDHIIAYFTPPPPTLSVDFPANNQHIAGKFYAEGDYTMAETFPYNTLQIFLGKESETGMITSYYFTQPISPPYGSFSIPITGVPAGHYAMAFNLIDKDNHQIYLMMTSAYRTIEIVNDIPPELPITGEVPPVISGQFDLIDPDTYYLEHSSYATSTSVYTGLTSALAPLIQSTGRNLADFALQFPQTSAKETGERIGNAILSARAYVANLNAFFADLPVATFFVLYLALLLAVILFRLVKAIISLFKL